MLALKKRMPQAKIKLVDRESKLFDRDTAALWVQLAQWLARANEPAKAVEAAQKAISLEPA